MILLFTFNIINDGLETLNVEFSIPTSITWFSVPDGSYAVSAKTTRSFTFVVYDDKDDLDRDNSPYLTTLTIIHNDPIDNQITTVPVTLNLETPIANFNQTSFSTTNRYSFMGDVVIFDNINITNTGNTYLNINGTFTSNMPIFHELNFNNAFDNSTTIAPGESTTLAITLITGTIKVGSHLNTLRIYHDDPIEGSFTTMEIEIIIIDEIELNDTESSIVSENSDERINGSFNVTNHGMDPRTINLSSNSNWLILDQSSINVDPFKSGSIEFNVDTSLLTQGITSSGIITLEYNTDAYEDAISKSFFYQVEATLYSVPDQVINIDVIKELGTVIINWESGGNGSPNPGSPILLYSVFIKEKDENDASYSNIYSGINTSTTYSTDMLVEYTIKIVATNLIGDSNGAIKNFQAEGIVPNPILFSAFGTVTIESLELEWIDDTNDLTGPTAVKSYIISARNVGDSQWNDITTSTANSASTSQSTIIEIPDDSIIFTAGNNYEFSIKAVNDQGESDRSNVKSIIIPSCIVETSGLTCNGVGFCYYDDDNNEKCDCNSDVYFGTLCENSCPTDDINTQCSGHGICNTTTIECECDYAYIGPSCTACPNLNDLGPCDADDIDSHGECAWDSINQEAICICEEGYKGNACNSCPALDKSNSLISVCNDNGICNVKIDEIYN